MTNMTALPEAVGKPTHRKRWRDGLSIAEENNLATIVGTKTPGRLYSGSAYKARYGYILGLPVAAYRHHPQVLS
jgi:hypothetical protein